MENRIDLLPLIFKRRSLAGSCKLCASGATDFLWYRDSPKKGRVIELRGGHVVRGRHEEVNTIDYRDVNEEPEWENFNSTPRAVLVIDQHRKQMEEDI